MSRLSDLLSAGFTAMHAVLGDEFEIPSMPRAGAAPYLGTFTAEKAEFGFQDIGTREKILRTVTALKSQFTAKPDGSLRPALDAFGSSYVVTGVEEDQLHYVLALEKRT